MIWSDNFCCGGTTMPQVAVVTGATGTIGRAIAAELGERGASLVITGRREEVLADVAGELRDRGVPVVSAAGDVTSPAHADDAVARAVDAFGPVTILVNNAGGVSSMRRGSIADSDPSTWRDTLLSNVYGPYLFSRAVLPSMLAAGRGRIITVASRAGTAAMPVVADYVVAKTAAIRLTEVIAAETVGRGVAAFSVHPGGVVNPAVADAISRGLVPADRFPDPPEAAARLVADLASGHYDTLSGAYLDIHDDLAALVDQRTDRSFRALRVVGLPDDQHARPLTR
jgi:NAD(P)-dependent dehydrogenase (short-subunit alcohol dehydrogenase family)